MNLWEALWANNPINKRKDMLSGIVWEVKSNQQENKSETSETTKGLGDLYKEISTKLGPLMWIDANQLEQWLSAKNPQILEKFTTLRDTYPKNSELWKVLNSVVTARRSSLTPGASLMSLIWESWAQWVATWAMLLWLKQTVTELEKNKPNNEDTPLIDNNWGENKDQHSHEWDWEIDHWNFIMKNEPLPFAIVSPVWDDPLIMTSPEWFREQFNRNHRWLDIKRVFQKLYATFTWVVKEVNLHSKWFGKKLVIEDPKTGVCQLMWHMKSIEVKVGDKVQAWQEVWISWDEWSDAHGSKIPPHLHLEYYTIAENWDKIYYDPAYSLSLLWHPEFIESMKKFWGRTDEIIAFTKKNKDNQNTA